MTGQELWETGIKAKNTTLFGKVTDWEGGRLMSQNNHFVGLDAWFFYRIQLGRGGKRKKKKKKPINL